jgi:hypothetical protein
MERIQAEAAASAGAPAPEEPPAAASGEPSPLGNRPAPLKPPPGSNLRTSGVLQWSGSKGEQLEIDGSRVTSGTLTGDALPGVPVRIWLEGENGSIVRLPTQADGYKHLILHAGSGRVKIHWATIAPGKR